VSAATVAPVGMYVRPLVVRAERWTSSRNRWSGSRACPSPLRQKRRVAWTRFSASSTSSGATNPSAHVSAQYSVTLLEGVAGARVVDLDPEREVGHELERLPRALASARWRLPSTSVHIAAVLP
jgi:hypothetical protein